MTFGYGRGHLSGVTSTRGCRSGRACEGSTSTTLSSCTGLHSPEAGRCSSMSTIVPWCDFAQVCCSSRPVLDIASLTSTRSMVESLPELMTQKGQECVKKQWLFSIFKPRPCSLETRWVDPSAKTLAFRHRWGRPGDGTCTRGEAGDRASVGSTTAVLTSGTGLPSPKADRTASTNTILPWCGFAQACCLR